MLKSAFSHAFNNRVVRGGASVGHFGGPTDVAQRRVDVNPAQIVVATDTNKILLQNAVCPIVTPPENSQQPQTDAVIVGTRSTLTVFDVFNNRTLFHRDMPEGVNCLKVGQLDAYKEAVLVCGCGTTVWGLHLNNGSDLFWTALGDEVNALELCDMDDDGRNELLVGSNGHEIKLFKNTTFLDEFDEGGATVTLCAIRPAMFAFGLISGVIGVYNKGTLLWRIKTKTSIVSLLPFPDSEHITCVWQNGKIDVRDVASSDIHFKDQVDGSGDIVAAVLVPRITPDETIEEQLALIYRNGKVHGLYHTKENTAVPDPQLLIREYGQRKHNLLEELRNLELREQPRDESRNDRSLVPANTTLESGLSLSVDSGLCLRLAVSNNVPIKAVLMFSEGIFENECYTIHPNGEESSQLSAFFSPTKDVVTELFIKVLAGFSTDPLHVFEVNQFLPKFATFLRVPSNTNFPNVPQSVVEFNMNIRLDRLNSWLDEKFIVPEPSIDVDKELNPLDKVSNVVLKFVCTRNNLPLILELRTSGAHALRHDNIDSAANILQSLCAHMNIQTLESRAYFPEVLKSVEDIIKLMDEKYAVIERLSSDWAERLNVVRESIVRAEDALNIKNIAMAKKLYVRVAMLNRELVAQQTIRLNSRQELLDALKTLNIVIEQFSRLRGEPASNLIKECRKAIAEENMSIHTKLLQFGV